MPILSRDNSSLYYSVDGTGTPIVFVHPPVLTSINFDYQREQLSKHFQVITFDIRGHGNSSYSNIPLTYPLIVEDIKHLLNHLGIEKAFICGYSTGGSILLDFLHHSSDRALGGIIVSGMHDVNDAYLRKKVSLGINLSKMGAIPLLAASMSMSNSLDKRHFKKMYIAARKSNPKNAMQYFHYSLHYNASDFLPTIHLPVLLVYGEKDKPFIHYAEELHKKLPNNELKIIPKVDHRIPTKNPKELNRLITEFINAQLYDSN